MRLQMDATDSQTKTVSRLWSKTAKEVDTMTEEGYPHLVKKYGTLEGNVGLPLPTRAKVDLEKIHDHDTLEGLKKEAEAAKEQRKLDLMFYYLRQTLGEIFVEGGHFEMPVPSVEELTRRAENFGINQLEQEINLTIVQVQRLNQAKRIIADTYTREKMEDSLWNKKPITISLPNSNRMSYVNTPDDMEELLALAKEKQKILDEGIAYYSKLKAAYEAQLHTMQAQASTILIEKLRQIKQVVRESKKSRETMIKIASEYRKKDKIDGKEAVKYVENKENFTALQTRYIHLHTEISKYSDPAALSLPSFPMSLNLDERSGESSISEAAKHAGDTMKLRSGMRRGFEFSPPSPGPRIMSHFESMENLRNDAAAERARREDKIRLEREAGIRKVQQWDNTWNELVKNQQIKRILDGKVKKAYQEMTKK